MSQVQLNWKITDAVPVPPCEPNTVFFVKLANEDGFRMYKSSLDGSTVTEQLNPLNNTGVVAGGYGPGQSSTLNFGGEFPVNRLTVGSDGRLTEVKNYTLKLPAAPTSVSGNAGTATKLQTARSIGGVAFDGTTNINLPGVNIAGNQSTTGNAATATKLATARTIGGVAFDGTTNISLPGVDTTGNQNTTGNAGSATKLQTARTIGGTLFDGTTNINIDRSKLIGAQPMSATTGLVTAIATKADFGKGSYVFSADELQSVIDAKPSPEEVFNQWYRFSHGASGVFPANATELGAWEYDSVNKLFRNTTNSETVIGMVSPEKYDEFDLEVHIKSTNGDDDSIGLVIAFVKDETGNEHALSVYRSPGGTPSRWVITYTGNTNQTAVNGNLLVKWGNLNPGSAISGTVGWNSANVANGTRIRVERRGDTIKCWTSQWDNNNTIDPSTLLELNLNSNPLYAVFKNPCQYGFTAHSQQSSSWEVINFTSPSDAIYDLEGRKVYQYIEGQGWVNTGSNLDGVPREAFLYNAVTKKIFFTDDQGYPVQYSGGEEPQTYVLVETPRATVAKVGTTVKGNFIPSFGKRIRLDVPDGFSNDNPTLTIDGGITYPMYAFGTTPISTAYVNTAAGVRTYVDLWFNGVGWLLEGGSHLNNTYSTMSVAEGTTATATTSRSMRSDSLKEIIHAHAKQRLTSAIATSGTYTTNLTSLEPVLTTTLTGNLTFNPPVLPLGFESTLWINPATFTVTWGSSIRWNGTAPSLPANKVSAIRFIGNGVATLGQFIGTIT